MAAPPKPALFGRRFLRHLAELTRIYWRSTDAPRGALLLGGTVLLELATVYGNLLLSDVERRVIDAFQDRQSAVFVASIAVLGATAAGFVLVAAYRVYLRQLLEIRWREKVTNHYVGRWMSEHAFAQLQLRHAQLDNPDQRISEDVRDFVASALGLSLSLLAALATLVSFGGLLWRLSANWALPIDGRHYHVPGVLLWIALAYAAGSTRLTHVVGRRLVPLNYDRLRYEADFRYDLMRFRDNIEAVTLSRGEASERRSAAARFQRVIQNFRELITAQRNLTLFTGVFGQANNIVPLVVAAPGFFAGLISLGTVVQIRFAYGQVSGALNWFVFGYQEIARWRANVERLATFAEVMDETEKDLAISTLRVVPTATPHLRLEDLRLDTPGGDPIIDTVSATVLPGERIAITGPSGAGKTVLLRAIAGAWPFGGGRIHRPSDETMLFVPQWPYLPDGSLRAAVSYPADSGAFPDHVIREVLGLLGLERLSGRLDDVAPWNQILSPHERQRLSVARVLLRSPDWLFLDKATSALDEETERLVYELLLERLPGATIISIAHRASIGNFHHRFWTITRGPAGPSSLRAA